MQSQKYTDYSVISLFALCYFIIIRLFYYIYICIMSMQRHRMRNSEKVPLPQDFDDEEKWLLHQQHEILKTKYKCLKELFHVYNANVIVHYKNNLQSNKRKQSLKKSPEANICETLVSSKISDFENSQTEITKFNYENYKEPCHKVNRARTVAIQTEDSEVLPAIVIGNKGGYHALNIERNAKPLRETMQDSSPSKISLFKNYIQKVLGQNREEKPTRIRNRRHISFNFSKKSCHKTVGDSVSIDNHPLIVSLVEVARKSCLADKSLRRCRIYGCGFISYGIIEYNNHMNAVHYPERLYICYFCHESFDKACDKFLHENKHLGVKFDFNGGSCKNDNGYNKQIKKTPSKDTNFKDESEKCIKVKTRDDFRNTIMKNTNVSVSPSNVTETTIYKTNKSAKMRKQKCPHTISITNQTNTELSECVSSKNFTNFFENIPNKEKLSCRFCQKSFDSQCKLLYHINLKHTEILQSSIDMSTHKDAIHKKKEKAGKMEHKISNSESICLSNMTRKSSKVGSLINKVRNGFHKYKWEPGTRIIRI